MATISDASNNYDDYERIVQVLRGRLALPGTKKWRQIFKALTVMEYLLTHGPEQFIMDFREEKYRVQELMDFVYLEENLVDKGSAVQSKAKQVNQLLVDEKFFKEQRKLAQTVSKGILGFGSQSLRGDIYACERPDFQKWNTHSGAFTLRVHPADCDRKTSVPDNEPSSPIPQRISKRSASSSFSVDDSPQISNASTEWNPFDESPTSSESFNTSSSPIVVGWSPPIRDTSPARKILLDLELRSTASSKSELNPQLPPAFPLTKCRVPPPPPGGSKVGPSAPPPPKLERGKSLPTHSHSVPDLILM